MSSSWLSFFLLVLAFCRASSLAMASLSSPSIRMNAAEQTWSGNLLRNSSSHCSVSLNQLYSMRHSQILYIIKRVAFF